MHPRAAAAADAPAGGRGSRSRGGAGQGGTGRGNLSVFGSDESGPAHGEGVGGGERGGRDAAEEARLPCPGGPVDRAHLCVPPAACLVSTGGETRRVRLVRGRDAACPNCTGEEGGGVDRGGALWERQVEEVVQRRAEPCAAPRSGRSRPLCRRACRTGAWRARGAQRASALAAERRSRDRGWCCTAADELDERR